MIDHLTVLANLCFVLTQIISLWFPKASLACDILRNCYEAFALYSFGSYLIACLGKLLLPDLHEQHSIILLPCNCAIFLG